MNILLVEDNPDHAELIKRALENHSKHVSIYHEDDAESALAFLQNSVGNEPTSKPDVILLDVQLPRMSGLSLLQQIKSVKQLNIIPIIMLTSSNVTSDIENAYRSGASSYLMKPMTFDQFNQLIEDFGAYWIGWNINPA